MRSGTALVLGAPYAVQLFTPLASPRSHAALVLTGSLLTVPPEVALL